MESQAMWIINCSQQLTKLPTCCRNNMDEDTHEKYVQLHMDILAYHSRVKNKAEESLRGIRAKVGFVPRDVEEHLQELQRVEVSVRHHHHRRRLPYMS